MLLTVRLWTWYTLSVFRLPDSRREQYIIENALTPPSPPPSEAKSLLFFCSLNCEFYSSVPFELVLDITNYINSITNYINSITNYINSITNYINSIANYINSIANYINSFLQQPK